MKENENENENEIEEKEMFEGSLYFDVEPHFTSLSRWQETRIGKSHVPKEVL